MLPSGKVKQLTASCDNEQKEIVAIAGDEKVEQSQQRRDLGYRPSNDAALLHELSNCRWKPDLRRELPLRKRVPESHNCPMTEKEIVLETIRALPDDCSLDEIAERIEFMAAVQKGLDQLDRGEGIPHEEIKRQLASWLTS